MIFFLQNIHSLQNLFFLSCTLSKNFVQCPLLKKKLVTTNVVHGRRNTSPKRKNKYKSAEDVLGVRLGYQSRRQISEYTLADPIYLRRGPRRLSSAANPRSSSAPSKSRTAHSSKSARAHPTRNPPPHNTPSPRRRRGGRAPAAAPD